MVCRRRDSPEPGKALGDGPPSIWRVPVEGGEETPVLEWRSPITTPHRKDTEEQRRAIEIVRKEPRSTKQGLKRIADEIGKVISGDTLKNILKANDFIWKRMCWSLRFFVTKMNSARHRPTKEAGAKKAAKTTKKKTAK